tara:strand:- start:2693 stop:3226 length:534 start_codon:yes stop_codon:yes gene_type:complete
MKEGKVIVDDNFLSDENKKYINEFVLANNYPYYITNNSIGNDNHEFLAHVAVVRPENRNPNFKSVNSTEAVPLLEILNDFIEKNNISCTRILRCAVNLSFNNGFKRTLSHVDHKFNHKSLLVYCTDNPDAKTVLEKKGKKFKEVLTKKYRGLYFENYNHYLTYPKKGMRVVIVFTFK